MSILRIRRLVLQTLGLLTRDGGSEIAEFAAIVPLLFMFILGIFGFGQVYRIYGAITSAARDGARAAASPGCTSCAAVDPSVSAWNAIKADLNAAHINPNTLQPPTTAPALCACAPGALATGCSSSTVPCDGVIGNICIQGVTHPGGPGNPAQEGNVELSSPGQGGAGECGVSVSMQYPFTLKLPIFGTQTLNLRAQAQMRAETQ